MHKYMNQNRVMNQRVWHLSRMNFALRALRLAKRCRFKAVPELRKTFFHHWKAIRMIDGAL